MDEIQSINDTKSRILHVVERIEKMNEMIALHMQQDNDDFMIRQYQFRKTRLLQDLEKLLESLNIKADLSNAA
jgi:hypothetical protein